jgi:hypothetical protein
MYSDGNDMAYKFYLPETTTITADLCNQFLDYNSKMEIFYANGGTTGYYNDDNKACSISKYSSILSDVPLDSGYYYIVVDGYNAFHYGDFQLSVEEDYGLNKFSARNIWQNVNSTKKNNIIEDDQIFELTDSIKIFPNPVTSILNITFPVNSLLEFELIDLNGKIQKSARSSNGYVGIDCSNLNAGLFILQVTSSHIRYQKKIIVTK